MTDIHGGRVLAGEDSEEDDDDDEAYSFQFGGFGSQSGASTSAPRFSVPAVVVAPQAGGEESDEEDDEEEEKDEEAAGVSDQAAPPAPKFTNENEGSEEDKAATATGIDEQGSGAVNAEGGAITSKKAPKSSVSGVGNSVGGKDLAATAASSVKSSRVERTSSREGDGELWIVEPSMDGVQMMGDAFVRNIQPSLDASIQRIEELRSNQKRLLQLLVDQNASVTNNKQIEDVAVVLDKLPHYFTKIQMIRATMTEITTSVDKMKRRAENLRIDAQSHALKKENKRDAQSQWNKLYAAKSAAPPSTLGES